MSANRRLFVAGLSSLGLGLMLPRGSARAESGQRVGVLCYHRFGPTVADSMTVRTSVLKAQLAWLAEHDVTVIPLRQLVDFVLGKGPQLPDRAIAITVDDGHASVHAEMLPIIVEKKLPVTLFIYPSAISNASYAMTWDQLRAMKATGLVDVQSHTYWHPNFKQEKKKQDPAQYAAFVEMQLRKPRQKLELEVGGPIDVLAWPFGIVDDELEAKAAEAGYVAAFTIDRRLVTKADRPLALPRMLMVDGEGVGGLKTFLAS
jgi:peptidoglycan/xylan/chitin deacetylase (PgdA/CDA1 family)